MPDSEPHTPTTTASNSSLQFFVYIVESPSEADFYNGNSAIGILEGSLRLNQIPYLSRTAISSDSFYSALRLGLPDAMRAQPDRIPILHLTAHGDLAGIWLSNGHRISWQELRFIFRQINQALNGQLILCMSSCKGYSAIQAAMTEDGGAEPYFAVIGCTDDLLWSDAAIGFTTFYHLINKRAKVPEAVNAMNVAAGVKGFCYGAALDGKNFFINHLKEVRLKEAQLELEAAAKTKIPTFEAARE